MYSSIKMSVVCERWAKLYAIKIFCFSLYFLWFIEYSHCVKNSALHFCIVTVVWHLCDTNVALLWQFYYSSATIVSHQYHYCDMNVAVLWQLCHNSVTIVSHQWHKICHNCVTLVLETWEKEVSLVQVLLLHQYDRNLSKIANPT